MKKLSLACLLLAAALAPARAADAHADPKELVGAIYAAFQPGAPKGDPSVHYSSRLLAIAEDAQDGSVYASDAAMAGEVFAPRVAFNPFLPDESALLFDLSIGEPVVIDDRALVGVSYHNFDAPHLLTVSLVREDGEWKVDDVASFAGEAPWLLSWALAMDPYAF